MICFRRTGEEVEIIEPAKGSRPRARVRRVSDGKEFEADYWELTGSAMGSAFWGLKPTSKARAPDDGAARWGLSPRTMSKRRALALALQRRGIE